MGSAHGFMQIHPIPEDIYANAKIYRTMVKRDEEELTEHLKIILDNSQNNLTLEQSIKFKNLLLEYKDVFFFKKWLCFG